MSLRGLTRMASERVSRPASEFLHGLSSFRNSFRRSSSVSEKSTSIEKKQAKPQPTTVSKMNIFGSDICSHEMIMSKIQKVQVSQSVVELEVDEILAMEDQQVFDGLVKLFLQNDRTWTSIKFRDSFTDPESFQDFFYGRRRLLERLAGASGFCPTLPISFQVKMNIARGEHSIPAIVDFLTLMQRQKSDISRLVLGGDLAGSDPCNSRVWETLVDFLANKEMSPRRQANKDLQRVSFNLFYDDLEVSVRTKAYSSNWKDLLIIAINRLNQSTLGSTQASFRRVPRKTTSKKKFTRRTKSANASIPDYRWDKHIAKKREKSSTPMNHTTALMDLCSERYNKTSRFGGDLRSSAPPRMSAPLMIQDDSDLDESLDKEQLSTSEHHFAGRTRSTRRGVAGGALRSSAPPMSSSPLVRMDKSDNYEDNLNDRMSRSEHGLAGLSRNRRRDVAGGALRSSAPPMSSSPMMMDKDYGNNLDDRMSRSDHLSQRDHFLLGGRPRSRRGAGGQERMFYNWETHRVADDMLLGGGTKSRGRMVKRSISNTIPEDRCRNDLGKLMMDCKSEGLTRSTRRGVRRTTSAAEPPKNRSDGLTRSTRRALRRTTSAAEPPKNRSDGLSNSTRCYNSSKRENVKRLPQ